MQVFLHRQAQRQRNSLTLSEQLGSWKHSTRKLWCFFTQTLVLLTVLSNYYDKLVHPLLYWEKKITTLPLSQYLPGFGWHNSACQGSDLHPRQIQKQECVVQMLLEAVSALLPVIHSCSAGSEAPVITYTYEAVDTVLALTGLYSQAAVSSHVH